MKLVCINCPLGCNLEVEKKGEEIIVSGNTCKRGEQYAINEMTHPLRMLTTTVYVEGAIYDCLPVITSAPIPKELLLDAMKELKHVSVKAPVKKGDIILKNICNTGVDIIASRSI